MSNDPDQIRADIERTRARLSDDVDTLSEEANPATIAKRQVDKVKDAGAGLKDKIMGSADGARRAAGGAPDSVKSKAAGNPLAAGLIAFGLGALVASLIPASEKEQQAVAELKSNLEPVKEQVSEIAQDAASNLKQPAQDAAQAVKETATEAADDVKSQGQQAVGDVQDEAQQAKESVQESRS